MFKLRINIHHQAEKKTRYILIAAGISLGAFGISLMFPEIQLIPERNEMTAAAQMMARAEETIRLHCQQTGIPIDAAIDPNRTGLIGPGDSGLTTTPGQLEAKRTTTNPNMAALIVHLLLQAKIKSDDSIAVAASGSFPALLIATLSAAHALHIRPVVIISLGASSYGSTQVDFNLLNICQLLREKGIFPFPLEAVSLGGEKDTGDDFEPSTRKKVMEQIKTSGITMIFEPDLEKNVAQRLNMYESQAFPQKIAAFINAGGGYAVLGKSQLVLRLKPGLNSSMSLPPPSERGLMFALASRGVPCLHLLFIRGLVQRYGLPWDPIPLPFPGEKAIPVFAIARPSVFWLITFFYFSLLLLVLFRGIKKSRPTFH